MVEGSEDAQVRKQEYLQKEKAEKKKKNPLPEFLFWYLGTLVTLYVLNERGILYPGRNARELLPPTLSIQNLAHGDLLEDVKFVVAGVALIYPLHLWRTFVKSWFKPLAEKGAGLKPGTLKYDKFLEQAWLSVHYAIVASMEIYALKTATNHWPPVISQEKRDAIIMNVEEIRKEQDMPQVQAVYLMQYTFYFMELATLVLDRYSRTRSDAFVYAFHHIITVFLISFSFLSTSVHAGMLVLIFHDSADIFLAVAKCFVYTEDHARVAYSRRVFKTLEISGVIFFIIFLITFCMTRLVGFPMLIYTAVYKGGWLGTRELITDAAYNDPKILGSLYEKEPIASNRFYLVMSLVLLLPLHVYWFRLACRVAYRAVRGIYDDERSDDEYEDESKDKKKN